VNGHLSEDKLINYAFDLGSQRQTRAIEAHLQGCAECRGQLEAIRGRFAVLDVLSEDIAVSEALSARVLAEVWGESAADARESATDARQGAGDARDCVVNRGGRRWAAPAWMGIAAGLLVIASVLVINERWKADGVQKKAVSGPQIGGDGGEHTASPEPVFGGAAKGLVAAGAPAELASAGHGVQAEERPPFAPASAIELVVLPRRENVQLTIYNSADLTLVRERRNLTLKKGWNWLQFMWANTLIDPTSLSLEPLEHKDKIEVQQLVYPARLKEIGRWLIRSEVEGQAPFEITYFTSGLSWRAFYMGTLSADEKTMQLNGYVRVDNHSGEEYENAQTRVIVGQVHLLDQIAELARRPYPYGSPIATDMGMMGGMGGFGGGLGMDKGVRYNWFADGDIDRDGVDLYDLNFDALQAIRKVEKEGLSEYFLYTIEGTDTIPNEWGKRLPSFTVDEVAVENLYKYDETRWGTETVRFVSFKNDADHNLGETPLPEGSVRIYRRAGEDGALAYTGGTEFKYIPVNEKAELNLGAARYVRVEPVLMESRTDHYQFDRNGNIDGWDEVQTWKVAVTNTREIGVKVEVFRDFGTPYWDIENSGQFDAFEKEDMDTVKFTVEAPARSKREFVYVLTTHQGTRREAVK
jgi:hypothetical protein